MNRPAAALMAAALAFPASAQVSPGPLSRAHADLEGNANCLKCHGTRKDALDLRCLDCHREIGTLREAGRGFHARDGKGTCAKCHPEHAGADFALVDWPGGSPERFDHLAAGFPLEGKHASQTCRACHQAKFRKGPIADRAKVRDAGRSFVGLEPACVSCHADPHKGALGPDCARCHAATDWKTTPGFDHKTTAFPLEGKHVAVACAKCHLPEGADKPLYKPVPHASCASCHVDPHAGRLGGACAKCHVVADWRQVSKTAFDHDRTRYPLRGAHATVVCAKCHDPKAPAGAKPPFATCGACHRDPHRGQATLAGKTVDCAACHSVQAFRPGVLPAAQHAPDRFPLEGKHATVACAKCHAAGPQGVAMRPAHARCADCHRDVHAYKPPRDCEPCHTVSAWVPSKVGVAEHRSYTLKLEGAHAKAKCEGCHRKPKLALTGVPTRCDACHRDVHAFAPVRDCAPCHDARAFAPASVGPKEHAGYAFPLEGAHAAAPCFVCHKDLGTPGPRKAVSFKDERRECVACHEDPHKGSLGKDCARCHGTAAFRPAVRFDHDRDTKFRLGTAHRPVACAKCHEGGRWKGAPAKCEACHGRRAAN
ncbi:MAG TPA: cytochrome c3 family protein [Candidatus Polarisedimenticolaceae bacterium]